MILLFSHQLIHLLLCIAWGLTGKLNMMALFFERLLSVPFLYHTVCSLFTLCHIW